MLELKAFLGHLKYIFLGANNTLPLIIAAYVNDRQVEVLFIVLQRFKYMIGWTITDIVAFPQPFVLTKFSCSKITS